MYHDLIVKGPNFPDGVRLSQCSDAEIKEWIRYGLEQGATAFETVPSEVA